MIKELTYIILMLVFFASCEDIYHPKIDIVEGHLIVESLITNDPNQNYVHLTNGTSFYDQNPSDGVPGALVNLIDGAGNITKGTESSSGTFHFNIVPVPGQTYKLQILYNSDTYESEAVIMPPIPHLINFYTGRIEKVECIKMTVSGIQYRSLWLPVSFMQMYRLPRHSIITGLE